MDEIHEDVEPWHQREDAWFKSQTGWMERYAAMRRFTETMAARPIVEQTSSDQGQTVNAPIVQPFTLLALQTETRRIYGLSRSAVVIDGVDCLSEQEQSAHTLAHRLIGQVEIAYEFLRWRRATPYDLEMLGMAMACADPEWQAHLAEQIESGYMRRLRPRGLNCLLAIIEGLVANPNRLRSEDDPRDWDKARAALSTAFVKIAEIEAMKKEYAFLYAKIKEAARDQRSATEVLRALGACIDAVMPPERDQSGERDGH